MSSPPSAIEPFERLRAEEFPGITEGTYLNAASMAPLPRRARAAMAEFEERRSWPARLRAEDLFPPLDRARAHAAELIGADPAEIALVPNTSVGINLAATCLPLPPDAVVVVSDQEFPANIYPWMNRAGMRLEIVPVDARGWPDEPRLLERLAKGDVSLLAVSSVQFTQGYAVDLEVLGRACREHGAFFVVDAIQSVGQRPLDVRTAGIDVLATGGHKWLCAPFGAGFAFVRRELHERMTPTVVGWASMAAAQDLNHVLDYRWEFLPDARRFEVGTPAFQDVVGLAASLELLLEVGVERIHAHLESLLEPLREWLEATPAAGPLSPGAPDRRSAIVSFRPPGLAGVQSALREAAIECAVREGAVRISPHLYNTRAEIEALVEVLDAVAGRGWR